MRSSLRDELNLLASKDTPCDENSKGDISEHSYPILPSIRKHQKVVVHWQTHLSNFITVILIANSASIFVNSIQFA